MGVGPQFGGSFSATNAALRSASESSPAHSLLSLPPPTPQLRRWPCCWTRRTPATVPRIERAGRAEGPFPVLDTIINGTTYHSSVYYDQIGFPTYEHFPSGRAIYLTDDLEGRSDWIGDSGGGTYVHQRYYEPYGTIEGEDLGNGLTQGWHHNDRMQVTEVDTYPTGAYNWSTQRMDIALGYTSAAQPMDNGNL